MEKEERFYREIVIVNLYAPCPCHELELNQLGMSIPIPKEHSLIRDFGHQAKAPL